MIPPALLKGSGSRILNGKQGMLYVGKGRIECSRAAHTGIDANLWSALKLAVDDLGIVIIVNSIDTGQHTPNSRHYVGCAVDINRVGTVTGKLLGATLGNPAAMMLVSYLQRSGFRVGEGGPWAALLFGPAHTALNPTDLPHTNHLHVSIARP